MDSSEEEHEWIRRSLDGEPDVFRRLIERYQKMIDSLAYRMTGSLDAAEDLAQETFIHAYRQLEAFRGDAKFSSWLYRIAVNRCLNWRRKRERQQRLSREWADNLQEPAPGMTAEQRRVQEALLQLSEKQRAAIVLTVYDGFNHAEAARILNCSETTVSWRIFAARKKLKRILSP